MSGWSQEDGRKDICFGLGQAPCQASCQATFPADLLTTTCLYAVGASNAYGKKSHRLTLYIAARRVLAKGGAVVQFISLWGTIVRALS